MLGEATLLKDSSAVVSLRGTAVNNHQVCILALYITVLSRILSCTSLSLVRN